MPSGTKLKVPELVPFRLTNMLEAALGATGVEGNFRVTCECVLRVLRHHRELLLTLLEAFVYDPLVDWTADKADDVARRKVELKVSMSLFTTRFGELKAALLQQHEVGSVVMAEANDLLSTLRVDTRHMVELCTKRDRAQRERDHALANAQQEQQRFAMLTSQLEMCSAQRVTTGSVEQEMRSLCNELSSKHALHETTLHTLSRDTASLVEFVASLNHLLGEGAGAPQPRVRDVLVHGSTLLRQVGPDSSSSKAHDTHHKCATVDADARACLYEGAEALARASSVFQAHSMRLANLGFTLASYARHSIFSEWAEFLSSSSLPSAEYGIGATDKPYADTEGATGWPPNSVRAPHTRGASSIIP